MGVLWAFVDGERVPATEARVALADEGLLRGDGCFEVVRVYDGRPFALEEHLERMARSAAALRLPLDGVDDAFSALCSSFDGFVRVLITRGPPPRVYGLQEPGKDFPSVMSLRSVAAPWLAPLGSTVLAGAKTLSYAHHMAARRLAEEDGYDDALLTTSDGLVLEGPTWSLMWSEQGRIFTPPLVLGILDSITRRVLMRLEPVTEEEATVVRLLQADEVMAVSTAREAVGVSQLDDHRYEGAPGPLTRRLAGRFRDYTARAT